MATSTTYLGLRKPAASDPISRQNDLNNNWDKIDTAVGEHLAERASSTTLGHVKQGSGVAIDSDGVIDVTLTKSDVGLGNVDNMSASEIRQAITIPLGLEVLTADPTTNLYTGRVYFNSSTDKVRVYSGTAWL